MLELDAMNQILAALGQSPVSSVSSANPAAISARATLRRYDKLIQTRGWWFNTDYDMTLAFNPTTLEVIVPGNTLNVEPSDSTLPYVQRGNRLYNRNETTFEIGENVDVDIVQQLDFETLPESAASAIAAHASYMSVVNLTGDQPKLDRLGKEKKDTRSELNTDDIRYSNTNVRNNPSVAAVIGGIRPVR